MRALRYLDITAFLVLMTLGIVMLAVVASILIGLSFEGEVIGP